MSRENDGAVPELPDIEAYTSALTRFIGGREIEDARLGSASLLRTWDPPLSAVVSRSVLSIERLGKRVVVGLEGDLFMIVHLMIAGRFHWRTRGRALARRTDHLALDFENGSLFLTEASSKKRAGLWIERSPDAVRRHDPGGIEPLLAAPESFADALRRENHTLKRALTDPRLFSGIGNAYSDEILHAARLSPRALTSRLDDDEVARLRESTVRTLETFTDRLRRETADRFPEKVTAFRMDMAVHGRAGQPCPRCGEKIQRIAYAGNECNYCARCQTGGKLLADRSLSRLLREDWPKTLEELEEYKAARRLSNS
jgi:formamidopyrimidine-DNA glycosylase